MAPFFIFVKTYIMRYLISILLFFSIFCSLSAQNKSKRGSHENNLEIDSISIRFQELSHHTTSDWKTEQKTQYLTLLHSIPYFNIRKYEEPINNLYSNYLQTRDYDTLFYIELIRYKALLDYQKRNYMEAIDEFDQYFNLFQLYYQNDTSYLFEYTKYCRSFLQTNQYPEFTNAIHTGFEIASRKIKPEQDKSELYFLQAQYYSRLMQIDSTRFYLNKAEEFWQETLDKDHRLISEIYKSKGYMETQRENSELAFIQYDKALNHLLMTDYSEIELANIYYSKGAALLMNRQAMEAIKQFHMTLHIYEKELSPNSPYIANVYRYIGLAYQSIGQYQESIPFLKKSIKINPKTSNYLSYRNLADAYSNIDSLHMADSLYSKTLNYLTETVGLKDYQTGVTLQFYGQFLIEKNLDKKKGESFLKACINNKYENFQSQNIDFIAPLNILGTYYLQNKQIDRGLDSLQSALNCASQTFRSKDIYENPTFAQIENLTSFNNTLAWKAYGLYLKYKVSNDVKDIKASFETYKFYIHCTRELRKYYNQTESIISSDEIYHVFNQAINTAYLLYQNTKDSIYLSDLFSMIEDKKSYTLFQSLNILEKKKLLQIPKELLKMEEDLKYSMGLNAEKLIAANSIKYDSVKLKKLHEEAFTLSEKLDSLQDHFKEEYSSFYNLKYGFKDLSYKGMQSEMDEETAFINYSISDSLLHIICITKENFKLETRSINPEFFQNIQTMVALLKKVNTDKSNQEFNKFYKSSRYLYDLLIKPTENLISGKKLIIIPDAELNYLSFDALLTEDVDIERPDYRRLPYLIKKFKSNVANSMQIYFNMRNLHSQSNDKVFAFAPSYKVSNKDSLPVEYRNLRPLDYSTVEVSRIQNYLKSEIYLGEDASEANFIKHAKDAGVLHLAMHTLINDQDPLYSKLLFTYQPETHSGLVNTYQLLSLQLNAELAVLSGCSTGDGELQKGEGVMSLSSGFQYAGVPAIVMSLWEVNDRFGALVIDKFYQYLSKGENKNQALYQAKLEVLSQGNALYAHPYYWAGLTLMGDDSKLSFVDRDHWDYTTLAFAGLLFLSVLIFQQKWKWRS